MKYLQQLFNVFVKSASTLKAQVSGTDRFDLVYQSMQRPRHPFTIHSPLRCSRVRTLAVAGQEFLLGAAGSFRCRRSTCILTSSGGGWSVH